MYVYMKDMEVIVVGEVPEEVLDVMKSDYESVFAQAVTQLGVDNNEDDWLLEVYEYLEENKLLPGSTYMCEVEFEEDDEDWECETDQGDTIYWEDIMNAI